MKNKIFCVYCLGYNSASNAMQRLKCVKCPCVNCHAKTNMRQMPLRQMPLRQKSPIVHLRQMPSRDKSPGVKIPALKFCASNIFCVKRVPPEKWQCVHSNSHQVHIATNTILYFLRMLDRQRGNCEPNSFHLHMKIPPGPT